MEQVVTDCESNRTFCLTVENGALVRLRELLPCTKHPRTEKRWVNVDKLSGDGCDWWEQWESEVKASQSQ